MLAEKRIQKIIEIVSKNIQVDVDVIDSMGFTIASSKHDNIGTEVPFLQKEWEKNKPFLEMKGKTYFRLDIDKNQIYYIAVHGTAKAARNYCYLISSLLEVYFKSSIQKFSREELFRRLLMDQMNERDLYGYARDYKIELEKERCVFVLQMPGMEAEAVHQILSKVFPKNKSDVLVVLNSRTLVLIKTIEEEGDTDDLHQLAQAIDDTIQSEISVKAYFGIGSKKRALMEIRESYMEAQEAIEVGRLHYTNERIFFFQHLLLERFLCSIPKEISSRFYGMLFREDIRKLLSDEIVLTIQKFFENSLNLSETARQLYIHRNTLVYRLDKIQKVTGLDLRNFDDAVTFKIMMMIGRNLYDNR